MNFVQELTLTVLAVTALVTAVNGVIMRSDIQRLRRRVERLEAERGEQRMEQGT